MKRVLVPIDFSECSEYAAKVAASIVRKNNGKLFLLHVLNLPQYQDEKVKSIEDIPEVQPALMQIRAKFAEFVKKPFLRGINIAEVLLFENVYDTVTEFSRENDINLVVMGSHGSAGIREFFIGSNTQKIVRMSDAPVLAVKNDIKRFDLKKVVFATDFSSNSFHAFERIEMLFNLYKSKIYFLKVNTKENFETSNITKSKAEPFLKDIRFKDSELVVINHTSIAAGIIEFADELKPDIIAMATEGRNTLYQIFNESIAEKIVNHSSFPILSVKIDND